MTNHGELKGYPIEEADANGFLGRRCVRCAWADRYTLLGELLSPDNWKWPYCNVNAYLTRSRITGHDKLDDAGPSYLASYETAWLELEYRSGAVSGGKLVTERMGGTAIPVPLNPAALKWDAVPAVDGRPASAGEIQTTYIGGFTYTRTIHHQTSIPQKAVDLQNCVNATTYGSTSLGVSFAAGTLRYDGFTAERSILTSGVQLWAITYYCSYHPKGWNKFWRTENGTWETINTITGNALTPFPPANLLQLG